MNANTNATRNESYGKLVAASRELARHALRTRNIRTQVEVIGALNLEKSTLVSSAEEVLKASQYELDVAAFELKKFNLDKDLGNPDFAEQIKGLEEVVKACTEEVASNTKCLSELKDETCESMKHLNGQIKEAEGKILRWETGENKVQLENVDKLSREYIEVALNEKAKGLSTLAG